MSIKRTIKLESLPQHGLVLITGANGHIGFRVLIHALRAGYAVRAAVRSEAKAALILSRPQIQALQPGSRLAFVIVPDITAPNAYTEAVQGVDMVIHVASPLMKGHSVPLSQHQEYFIEPARRGTLALLEAARQTPSMRRVVITSSIVALAPIAHLEGTEKRTRPIGPDDRTPFVEGPYESEFAAYTASKVAALEAAESWMRRERPRFDLVHLHPSFVLGRNDMATSAAEAMRGSNGVVIAMLLGKKFGARPGASVHVEDVARAHVRALDASSVPGDRSYVLSRPAEWHRAVDVARRDFAPMMKRRLLVATGSVESVPLDVDTRLTDAALGGGSFLSFETQVRSLVRQFAELRSAPAARTLLPAKAGPRSLSYHVAASA